MQDATPIREFVTDFDLVTIVLRLDSLNAAELEELDIQFKPAEIEAIEEELDETIQVTQSIGSIGPSVNVTIPSRQMDMAIAPQRIEVRSQKPEFSKDTAEAMVRLMRIGLGKYGSPDCQSIGHNYLASRRTSDGTAIQQIQKKLMKEGLNLRSGNHRLLGGSCSLWFEVEDSILLLKTEPSRASKTTSRYQINANFSVELGDEGEIPESDGFVERLLLYCRRFETIVDGLGL